MGSRCTIGAHGMEQIGGNGSVTVAMKLEPLKMHSLIAQAYKECFVLLPNRCWISQSTPFRAPTLSLALIFFSNQRGMSQIELITQVTRIEFVMSHIGLGGEQNTLSKGVEIFPYQTYFKALRGNQKGKRRQYLLAVDLGRYNWY